MAAEVLLVVVATNVDWRNEDEIDVLTAALVLLLMLKDEAEVEISIEEEEVVVTSRKAVLERRCRRRGGNMDCRRCRTGDESIRGRGGECESSGGHRSG